MISSAVSRARLPRPAVLFAIAAAWAVALVAEATGRAEQLHHDWLLEGGLSPWAALGVFVVAWQVMLAAMMLPSSLPMISLFDRTSASQPRPGRARLAFLGGYAVVWTGFGALAFVGDAVLHATVHRFAWLASHPEIIGGTVLVGAGLFQFSALKEACLEQCRHPAAFLLRHYARGPRAGFRLGSRHGAFCIGCCWALMLVMFAVGASNLVWMGALTLVMVYEKTAPRAERGVWMIGVGFVTLGVLVLLGPGWLPEVLQPR